MKKYDSYKDSGIEWIGIVPEKWNKTYLKHNMSKIYGGGTPSTSEEIYWSENDNDIPWVAISDISSCDKDLYLTKKKITEEGRKSKNLDIIPKGTLLLSIFASLGKTVRLGIDATVNQAILGLEPNEKLHSKFLEFLLVDVERYISQFSTSSTQENLNLNKIKNLFFYLPNTIEEQTAIANYLDHKTYQIDDLITKKLRLIQLLEEERTAIINQAVTKGLDPTVPMKDSGIEWLGEIPAHWEVKRMRYLCDITTGGKDTENREDDGQYPFYVRSQTVERISTYSFDGEAILTAGDGVGVCKVWHYVNEKFDFHQRVYMMCNFKSVIGKYLFYYLKENFGKEVMKLSAKSTVDSLRRPMFQNFLVCFGSIEEQEQIIHTIDNEEQRIQTIVVKTQQEIELLKEYKTALISEVVTGKVDVRNEKLN
jgi:type I restriction enzyme S subunit